MYTYESVPITNADDGPYKRVGAENDGGGGSRVATREGRKGEGERGGEGRGRRDWRLEDYGRAHKV